jgi:tetratricopeptide (TPR) repeat protein
MADRLEDLLRASTVRVTGGPMPGAGFFVAPGKVLTCLHVVGDSPDLLVRWERDGHPLTEAPVTGRVAVLADRGRPIPALEQDYPDIAVLEVAGATGHPCVWIDPDWPSSQDSFQVFGYPREGGAVRLTPARLTYRGTHGTAPTAFLDLASDTVKPGMSGAPVLNLRSGGVCGVVVASKHPSHPDGALAVPWSAIAADLSDVLAANRAFHQRDRRWDDAAAARQELWRMPGQRAPAAARPALPTRVRALGRDVELGVAAAHALAMPPVPTVVLGTAGIGKTNLTTALIHDQRITAMFGPRRFVVRCEAAFSALDLVANLAEATGIPPGPGALAAVLALLDEAPAMVVLDNSETPWEADTSQTEQIFAQLASITGLALVISMREGELPAGPGWGPAIRLGPLDARVSRELFLDTAGQRFDQPGLDALLGEIGGIPLGIELLARYAEGEEDLGALAASWQRERSVLLARASADTRQLSVLVSFELSWNGRLMTEPSRRLLAVLSRLPDGIARDDLESLLPGVGHAAARTLQARGLAFYEAGRVRTHPLWRHHVSDHYPPGHADWQRAVAHYLQRGRELAVEIGQPSGETAAGHLATDAANIRVTLLDAMGAGEPAAALRDAAVVIDAARFMAIDLGELPGAVFAATQRTGDARSAAKALVALGAFFRERSVLGRAQVYLEQALVLYRQAGSLSDEAACLYWLGNCARDLDDVKATGLYGQALALYRQTGNIPGQADALKGLGHCAREAGQTRQAREHYGQALQLYRRDAHRYGEANCVCRLGDCARDLGEIDAASDQYDRALALYHQIGDLHGKANALMGLGDCARLRSDTDRAGDYYTRAQDLYRQVGHARGEANSLQRLRLIDTSD